MRHTFSIGLVLMAYVVVAGGQLTTPVTNARTHISKERGCTSCHTPHRGGGSNDTAHAASHNGRMAALWGEDVTGQYEKTVTSDGMKDAELAPAPTPEVTGLLTCLSCHDGNMAQAPAMNERVYEKLPANYEASDFTLTPNSIKPAMHEVGGGVVCTTCHDPHAIKAVKAAGVSGSSLYYSKNATTFFFRALRAHE